ncbi:MAG: hypothetical protein EOP45_21750 [Sphingobacteriaceae bacterium]|nr:MAG: hypothetical protein EOP45_21750 [Sphingobacteriaceae bacterium]
MPTEMRQEDRSNRIEELRLISRRRKVLESLQIPSLSLNSFLDVREVKSLFSLVYNKSHLSNRKVDFYFYDRETDTMLPGESAYEEALDLYKRELTSLELHETLAVRENFIWFIVYENTLDAIQLKIADLLVIVNTKTFGIHDDEIVVSSVNTQKGLCLLRYEYNYSVSQW